MQRLNNLVKSHSHLLLREVFGKIKEILILAKGLSNVKKTKVYRSLSILDFGVEHLFELL
jgi:hypothetical protein